MTKHNHYIIYKPFGMLSQFVNNKTRKKPLLSELFDFAIGTMAIGRLDAQSEGLLFLTTHGKLSEEIRSRKVEKEYWVQIDGTITQEAIEKLCTGTIITVNKTHYKTQPCNVEKIEEPNLPERGRKIRDKRHGPTSWLSITLTEGKNRQVRKMTASVGFPTLRLVRYRIGNITLDGMNPGEVIEVTNF
ncbi:MAG: pseudouridine synthase [Bacteroidia bacterium]